jgi:hypothetical protein
MPQGRPPVAANGKGIAMSELTSNVSVRQTHDRRETPAGISAAARIAGIVLVCALSVVLVLEGEFYPPFDEAISSAPDLSAIGFNSLAYSP